MSTVVKGYKGNSNSLLLKGAPERVIEKCTDYKLANGEKQKFTKEDKENLIKEATKLANEGLRCLGLVLLEDAGKLANLND